MFSLMYMLHSLINNGNISNSTINKIQRRINLHQMQVLTEIYSKFYANALCLNIEQHKNYKILLQHKFFGNVKFHNYCPQFLRTLNLFNI